MGTTQGTGRRGARGFAALLAALVAATVPLLATAQPAGAAFPGGNGKIAFASYRDGDYEIYVQNEDGTGLEQVTDNASLEFNPSLSPDGERVAFESNNQVYVADVESKETTAISGNAGGSDPAFSPSGREIAFTSYRDGDREIYETAADGSGAARNLTNDPAAEDFAPSYDPLEDGDRLAFTKSTSSVFDGADIYVLDRNGGSVTRVTDGPDLYTRNTDPAYSPDGARLAFASNRDGGNYEVYTIPEDGGEPTRITNNAGQSEFPAYSPDGERVVYQAYRSETGGGGEIYTASSKDGSGETNVTQNAADDRNPDWGVSTVHPPGFGGCTVRGTDGRDELRGTDGRDMICGGEGDDTIRGMGGNDVLRGGPGDDTLYGGEGRDELYGGPGRDTLYGGPGEDLLRGGAGRDDRRQ